MVVRANPIPMTAGPQPAHGHHADADDQPGDRLQQEQRTDGGDGAVAVGLAPQVEVDVGGPDQERAARRRRRPWRPGRAAGGSGRGRAPGGPGAVCMPGIRRRAGWWMSGLVAATEGIRAGRPPGLDRTRVNPLARARPYTCG